MTPNEKKKEEDEEEKITGLLRCSEPRSSCNLVLEGLTLLRMTVI
jgi:hypothetical protein